MPGKLEVMPVNDDYVQNSSAARVCTVGGRHPPSAPRCRMPAPLCGLLVSRVKIPPRKVDSYCRGQMLGFTLLPEVFTRDAGGCASDTSAMGGKGGWRHSPAV